VGINSRLTYQPNKIEPDISSIDVNDRNYTHAYIASVTTEESAFRVYSHPS